MQDNIKHFFEAKAFAVVGASTQRHKIGNKVLRCYLQNNKTVYAVNPREVIIEGVQSFPSTLELPNTVESISIITPPVVTEIIVEQAICKGIKNIWMQPGAESDKALELCHTHQINVIAGGPCILVELGFKEQHPH